MKKIITALGNPILNNELKKVNEFNIITNDIQYQEGIFEILEKEKNIDFLVLSEIILGEFKIEKLIEKIKLINQNLEIIIILENKKEELENYLYAKGIFNILYNNEIEIIDIINLIKNKREDENKKIKKELEDLKEIVLNKENNKLNIKTEINKIINKINNKNNFKKEIICVSGTSGVGKSIFTINLANSLIYSKIKILIIDFDILNNSLHTILGLEKYPEKIKKKIKNNDLINSKLNIKELIIKLNKKIDLISGINLLFDSKYKISSIKIDNIFKELREIYDLIIVDTSSECFFDYTKSIIKLSNINIFISEANLSEIKKAKNLLNIYINEWNINKNKINILFNKYDNNSIDINLLKNIFYEFNIIGKINFSHQYNLIINKNIKNNSINKKIKKEYINISEKIFKKINKQKIDFIKLTNKKMS